MRQERFIEICKKHGLEQLTKEGAVKTVIGGKHYICFSFPEDHDRVIAQLNRNNNQIKLKNSIEIYTNGTIDIGCSSTYFDSEDESEFEKNLELYLKLFKFIKKDIKKFQIESICKEKDIC